MTQPTEPPPRHQLTAAQAAAAAAEDAAVEQDTGALLPALLAVLAAYATYKMTTGRINGTWQTWARVLKLDALIGRAMAQVAERAVARLIDRATPAHAAELAPWTEHAVRTSVDTQLRTLAQALMHYQRIGAVAPGVVADDESNLPRPPRVRPHPKPSLPNQQDPPEVLAEMLAVVGRNAAQLEAEVTAALVNDKMLYRNWQSVNDSRVRPSHQFLGSPRYEHHSVPGQEPFTTIFGAKMMFPGDMSLGAPISECAGCRCFLTFSTKSEYDPQAQQYFPAFWIHKKRGDQHDEMEYRAAQAAARAALMKAKEDAWASNPDLAAAMAAEQARRRKETPAQTRARHLAAEAAFKAKKAKINTGRAAA